MLSLNIRRMLSDRQIERPHLYLRKLGISAHTATNLLEDNFSFINIAHIEKLCIAFKCTPSDLFVYKSDAHNMLPANHPLHQLKERPAVVVRLTHLGPDQLEKLHNYVRDMDQEQ